MSNRISRGFDFLAPFYDALARLVIGKDIVDSQLHFLDSFKSCKHILILGGGSGWILKSIYQVCPDIRIDYVELSSKMISSAQKNSNQHWPINFILGTEDQIPHQFYDGVITNFYLDMFDERKLSIIISKIKRSLNHSSLWVATDFVHVKMSHNVILWIMYRFFRLIARIEATHLPNWQKIMIESGLATVAYKTFKGGFIQSSLYSID